MRLFDDGVVDPSSEEAQGRETLQGDLLRRFTVVVFDQVAYPHHASLTEVHCSLVCVRPFPRILTAVMLTEPKSRLADCRIVRVERCSQEGDTGQILAINLGLQSGRGREGTNPAAGRRDESENRSMSEPALAMRQVSKTHGLGLSELTPW